MGNYDRKKSTPCTTCMNCFKWIPVIFIAAVIAWSYYAYVVQLCILAIESSFQKAIYLIFYHIVSVLFLWSYWNTIFTPAATVPSNWRIPEAEIERLFRADSQDQQKRILEYCARDLPVNNRTPNGSVRFCEKCKIIKPDRAHHCSVCGMCILKMDHHCPWVNNCVNFANYKFFVLFLGYALLYCLYVALTSLEYFIRFWKGDLDGGMGRFHILFLFFISVMFAISLVSLFGYHIYLVLMNRTTLEAFRAPIFRIGGPDKNGYNLGKSANFQEVFGDEVLLWFLPVASSLGDGITYPLSRMQRQNLPYDSMGVTRARTNDDLDVEAATATTSMHPCGGYVASRCLDEALGTATASSVDEKPVEGAIVEYTSSSPSHMENGNTTTTTTTTTTSSSTYEMPEDNWSEISHIKAQANSRA